jgi:predicted Zn-dependent peptidase
MSEKKKPKQKKCGWYLTSSQPLRGIEANVVKLVVVAEKAVLEEIEKIKNEILDAKEVQKVINKTESVICFEDMSIMNRAHSLAYYELLGDADLMNKELGMYQRVTPSMIQHTAQKIFQDNNRNTLYYYSKS